MAFDLYSAENIRKLTQHQFETWVGKILKELKNPTPFAGDFLSSNWPDDSWLHECWCPTTQSHARNKSFWSKNLRADYEEKLFSAVRARDKNEPLRLLSGGSGGLFQDLVILLKLHRKGFKKIHLDCMEVRDNSYQQNILAAIIEQLNKSPQTTITVNHYSDNIALPFSNVYDLAYFIDAEEISNVIGKDCTINRDLPRRKVDKEKNSYNFLSLILYAMATLSLKGICLVSYGKNNFIYNSQTNSFFSKHNEFIPFNTEKIMDKQYDCFYINANPMMFLFHIEYFAFQKKPVFVNQDVLNEFSEKAVLALAGKFGFELEIISENEVKNKFIGHEDSVFVFDGTAFNEIKKENPHDGLFSQKAHVARVPWANELKEQTYPKFTHFKACQIKQRLTQYSYSELLKLVIKGCEDYLAWRKQYAVGTRGLTRFSHWSHGDSGIKRAKSIALKAHQFLSQKEECHQEIEVFIKQEIYDECAKSGDAKHSCSRFIAHAISEDKHDALFDVSKDKYRQIRHVFQL